MTEAKPYKVINSIHKLKYCHFKEIMLEGNFSLLVLEGEPSESEIISAWEDILNQHSEAMGGNNEDVFYYSSFQDYLHTKRKYEKIVDFIHLLRKVYVQEWMTQLLKLVEKKLPKDYIVDPTNTVEYFKLLDSCESRSKGTQVYLDIAELKLESLRKKREDNSEISKPSYESFDRIELNLDLYFSMSIDYNSISHFKYCELCKRYVAAAQSQKQPTK